MSDCFVLWIQPRCCQQETRSKTCLQLYLNHYWTNFVHSFVCSFICSSDLHPSVCRYVNWSRVVVLCVSLKVVGSQARILYSDQKGRIAIALAFNTAVSNGTLKVSSTTSLDVLFCSGIYWDIIEICYTHVYFIINALSKVSDRQILWYVYMTIIQKHS